MKMNKQMKKSNKIVKIYKSYDIIPTTYYETDVFDMFVE
jgi:hypothetical protein